jgi:hypothetical protein
MDIKNIGLTILVIAAAILIGNGIYHLIVDLFIKTDMTLIVKVGIFGIIIGLVIIIIGLILERLKDKKNEKF